MFLPPTPSVLSFSPELCADVKDLRVFKYISTLPFCFVFFKRKKKKQPQRIRTAMRSHLSLSRRRLSFPLIDVIRRRR